MINSQKCFFLSHIIRLSKQESLNLNSKNSIVCERRNIMAALKLTKENFEQEVLRSDKPVLVDFFAPWCGPCKMVLPLVDELADEEKDVKIGKVNVEDQKELARKFRVMSIPTLLLFKDGQVVETSLGAKPKEAIRKLMHS
ncbi:thioredoxin [Bacilliculturomica massiliensis]